MSIQLLHTKWHMPDAPAGIVIRSRLDKLLDAGAMKRITLIAAPAGSGKSTLISQWLRSERHLAAWVTLDEADNDPVLFWAYMVSALQDVELAEGRRILEDLDPLDLPPPKILITTLINELVGSSRKIFLVLDDYHQINNPVLHEDLSYLIEYQPPMLHLILLTRQDPPLPTGRLRGQGQLSELRGADLRFSGKEAEDFLNEELELELEFEELEMLQERTEGWAIGLQLAGLALRSCEDRNTFIRAFSGSHRYVLEYLMHEVVQKLPPHLREFMQQTALLDQFCAPLCDSVLERSGSREMIEQIRKQNLFLVTLDEGACWHRFHHLFRDLLLLMLSDGGEQQVERSVLRRASAWFEEKHRAGEAVRYAMQAKDFEKAAELISVNVESLVSHGQVKTAVEWLEALPEDVVDAHPGLQLHYGYLVFLTGNVSDASVILERASRSFGEQRGEVPDPVTGRLGAVMATIRSLTHDLEGASAAAHAALEVLPEDDLIFRARAVRVLGVSHGMQGRSEEAISHLETGEELARTGGNRFLAAEILSQAAAIYERCGSLYRAESCYKSILELYTHPEQHPPACLGYIGLAGIAFERNQLDLAEDFLEQGIELARSGRIGYTLQPACLLGGLIKSALGNHGEADDLMNRADSLSKRGGGSQESILGLAVFHVRYHLLLGDVASADCWARGGLLPGGWDFQGLPAVLDETCILMQARVALFRERFEDVVTLCSGVVASAEAGGRWARVLEARLLQAGALLRMKRSRQAEEVFQVCLRLADPQGYIRMFVEAGEPIRTLLESAAEKEPHSDFAVVLMKAFDASEKSVAEDSYPLVEKLSSRELEVLQLMMEGFSNQAIADHLVVSINTVKKHTSNIYGKMGVQNRTHAVLKARELGIG